MRALEAQERAKRRRGRKLPPPPLDDFNELIAAAESLENVARHGRSFRRPSFWRRFLFGRGAGYAAACSVSATIGYFAGYFGWFKYLVR